MLCFSLNCRSLDHSGPYLLTFEYNIIFNGPVTFFKIHKKECVLRNIRKSFNFTFRRVYQFVPYKWSDKKFKTKVIRSFWKDFNLTRFFCQKPHFAPCKVFPPLLWINCSLKSLWCVKRAYYFCNCKILKTLFINSC